MRSYTSKPTKPIDFELDGITFTATGGVAMLEMLELAKYSDLEADSPEGAAALREFFVSVLGDEYDRFRRHTAKYKTDPNTLVTIVGDLIEEFSAVPFESPSASPDGPPTTGPSLRVVSSDKDARRAQIARMGGEVSLAG